MFRWIKEFIKATLATQAFFVVTAIFLLVIIVTTIYSYARLQYVHSYKEQSS